MGNDVTDPHYLTTNNSEKVEIPEGKELLHREVWEMFSEYHEDEDQEAAEKTKENKTTQLLQDNSTRHRRS